MDHRRLGNSGLRVGVLSFGTATFGGAVGWNLTPAQIARLDAASEVPPSYPVWHQRGFPMPNERG